MERVSRVWQTAYANATDDCSRGWVWQVPLAADEFGVVCHAWPGFAGQACRFGTDIRGRSVKVFGDRCRIEDSTRSTRTTLVLSGVVVLIRPRKSNTCLSRKAGPSMAHKNSQDAVWGREIPSASIRGHTRAGFSRTGVLPRVLIDDIL